MVLPWFFFAEYKEVEDFHDAERVDQKQDDKPVALVKPRRTPQRPCFPRDGPCQSQYDNPRIVCDELLHCVLEICGRGGIRTHKLLRAEGFKPSA